MTIRTTIKSRVQRTFERLPMRRQTLHYLVYYDGGLAGLAALREACEMAKPGTHITAVFLEQVPLEQAVAEDVPPRSMLSQAILAAAIVNARLYGVEIETLDLPCHSQASAFVALASKHDNAVLFIGVTEHETNERQDTFIEYVLALAPCQVVLVSG